MSPFLRLRINLIVPTSRQFVFKQTVREDEETFLTVVNVTMDPFYKSLMLLVVKVAEFIVFIVMKLRKTPLSFSYTSYCLAKE